jgi:hypothetical protein
MFNKKNNQRQLEQGVNERISSGPSAYGKRLLEQMGWKEGSGAGKYEQGNSDHIHVIRRKDEGLGLGAKTSTANASSVSDNPMPAFDPAKLFESAASMFNFPNIIPSSTNTDEIDSDDNDDDDDNVVDHLSLTNPDLELFDLSSMTEADRKLFLRCNGRMLGQRSAPRLQKGKLKREKLAREQQQHQQQHHQNDSAIVINKGEDQQFDSNNNIDNNIDNDIDSEQKQHKKKHKKKRQKVDDDIMNN